jgi:REP element-mobilizing transposase RayT
MPNHVHLVLYLIDDKVNLNTIISNAKRFMAYAIVDRLKEQHNNILDKLAAACTAKERSKGQRHKIFEPSFDAKVIYSLDFLYQKLDYIHHNPVSKKWSLCSEFTDYTHSSASFYELGGLHPNVFITDFRAYWF